MTDTPLHSPHRWLFERIPGVCLIETDASGVITHFGPAAEIFFNCTAADAIGHLHYEALHEAGEMEACRDDPEFKETMERQGWSEEDWTVVPRSGERFRARVTLLRKAPEAGAPGERGGWIALYRRL